MTREATIRSVMREWASELGQAAPADEFSLREAAARHVAAGGAPSGRRWRTLVRLEDRDGEIWAVIPGWSPRVAIQVAGADGHQLIPVELAAAVDGLGSLRVHATLRIGSETWEGLGFEDAEWEVEP